MQIPFAPLSAASYKSHMEQLQTAYPFAAYAVFGRSAAKRPLFSLSLGDGPETVFLLGGLSPADAQAPLLLLRFFARLCACWEQDGMLCGIRVKSSLYGRKIVVVPMLNPDGYEIRRLHVWGAGCFAGLVSRAAQGDFSTWCANARGVRIDRNFDFQHQNPADKTFSPNQNFGYAPASEPETQACMRLCAQEHFRHSLLLSGYGRRVFWQDFSSLHQACEIPLTAKILAGCADYTLSKQTADAVSGTFPAWFADTCGQPAYTLSPGRWAQPVQERQFDTIYEEIEEPLLLSCIL